MASSSPLSSYLWHMRVHPQEEKDLRRAILDFYGTLGVFTTLVLIPAAVCWLGHLHRYNLLPKNRRRERRRGSTIYSLLSRFVYHSHWYLGRPLFSSSRRSARRFGSRKSWLLGTSWVLFILFMAVSNTGDDYFHLTKRLAQVAASLLPAQYLLSARFILQQTSIVTYQTHETLNKAHRWLGRTIYTLLTLHGLLYANFFLTTNRAYRFLYWDVVFGLLGIVILNVMLITSLPRYRRAAYGAFFSLHQLLSILILPVAWLHVYYTRRYVFIAGAVYVIDRVGRYIITNEVKMKVTAVSSTALDLRGTAAWMVSDTAGVEKTTGGGGGGRKGNGKVAAGSHYYVYVPSMARSRGNPFTMSSVDVDTGEVKFLVRVRGGFTGELGKTCGGEGGGGDGNGKVGMVLEGPYGIAQVFPGVKAFDAFLFVTGGIGITMTLSVLRELVMRVEENEEGEEGEEDEEEEKRIKFVWAVGGVEDAAWPLAELLKAGPTRCRPEVEIFISGSSGEEEEEEVGKDKEEEEGRPSMELDDLVGGGEEDSQRLLPTTEPGFMRTATTATNTTTTGSSRSRTHTDDNDDDDDDDDDDNNNDQKEENERGKVTEAAIESLRYRYSRTGIRPRIERGRPDLKRTTEEFCEEARGRRIAVVVCGPEGMGWDVRRALERHHHQDHGGGSSSNSRSVIWVWDERFGL